MEMDHFYTIESMSMAEYKDRGSRFVAQAFPIMEAVDFKKTLAEIKQQHKKAAHHCFAYRMGIAQDNFRTNDDGEPSGSAGKPILGQIDSKKLTNVAVVVSRYFGGTLLGVPGLINAYKTSAVLCLQTTPIIRKEILLNYEVAFDYTIHNEVLRVLKQSHCIIFESNIQLFSTIRFGVTKHREDEVVFKMKEIHNVSIKKIL
jgi:uncharacterized YigZ family protein